MRIIFVGIHNKKGLMPLCSSTKSGKLIDRIIKVFRQAGIETIKTNLYDIYFMPDNIDKDKLAIDWHLKTQPRQDDVIVLLGNEVQKSFSKIELGTINLRHPASIWSNENQIKYVSNAINEIKKTIN